jgi:hypothetical protein
MAANDTAADKAKKRKRAEETLKWGTGKQFIAVPPSLF